jgi:dimethylhistidine N-methyltransferase
MPDDARLLVADKSQDVGRAALDGLLQAQKSLPPWLFYDEEGCRLFQRITELPEYYLTRTERALLITVAPRVVSDFSRNDTGTVLIEYGASDESKADALLAASDATGGSVFGAYVPIDVAAPALNAMAARLRRARPDLVVHPIAADFLRPVSLPPALARLARLGFFPGSTIGNMRPLVAQRFLRQAQATLGPGARFLVGADLRKDPDLLIPAYDDAAGVTAAFNLNLLVRLNREAAADFDLTGFDHRAVWNDRESRIEMHLVSRHRQIVRVAGVAIPFAAGETIHTEDSYKHTEAAFEAIATAAGWTLSAIWTDPARLFALYLLEGPASS